MRGRKRFFGGKSLGQPGKSFHAEVRGETREAPVHFTTRVRPIPGDRVD
jgi:hypothetical protein